MKESAKAIVHVFCPANLLCTCCAVKKYGQSGIVQFFPCPFPVHLAATCPAGARGPTAALLPSWLGGLRVRGLLHGPQALQVASSSWEGARQEHLGDERRVIFKSLPGPGGEQEKGKHQLLTVCHSPLCVKPCVYARACSSLVEKDCNTSQDLPL